MKNLKCFEAMVDEWNNLSNQEKRKLQYGLVGKDIENDEDYKKSITDYILLNHSLDIHPDIEDVEEYIETFIDYDYKILPKKVKLYRVVFAENKEDIDIQNVGSHYVLDKRMISDSDFLYDIGISSIDNSKLKKLWCIEVLVNKDDIDLERTLLHRVMNPNEEEITMKKNYKPLNIKVEKLDLGIYENYKITRQDKKNSTDNYYFETEKYDYIISFSEYDDKYYSVSFKAKLPNEYFFNSNVITNENPYKILNTVITTIKDFYIKKIEEMERICKKYNIPFDSKKYIKGFVFSFVGDKNKNLQRLNFYKRYFNSIGIDVEFSVKDNIYYLSII